MAKTESFPTQYLKHKGVFSLKEMIQALQDWYGNNGYDFKADKYKLKPNEAEYEMSGERKINEYVLFKIKLHVWVNEMSDVEIVQDGEKKLMNNGNVRVELDAEYTLDYENRFRGNKFLQWLQDIYHDYIIFQTIDQVWEDELFSKSAQLMGLVKEQLGVEAG
jgi:hypothetical protein